jgi:hypothetical protein
MREQLQQLQVLLAAQHNRGRSGYRTRAMLSSVQDKPELRQWAVLGKLPAEKWDFVKPLKKLKDRRNAAHRKTRVTGASRRLDEEEEEEEK